MKIHSQLSDVISEIRPGMRVFVHGGAAVPLTLMRQIVDRAPLLGDLEFIHLHLEGFGSHANPAVAPGFRVANLFVGASVRPFVDYERVDYLPCFLSEIPALFRSGVRPIDVALIHVSPPDAHGYCSLGVSADVAIAAVDSARIVIAQINPRMPRVHGDGIIATSKISHAIWVDEALPESSSHSISEEEHKIGERIAAMVEDGSTLQVGIGAIPEAALSALRSHRHLGLHTEMWSDRALDLIECGAIDNSRKRVHPGKSVSGFAMGTRRLYDYMHDNPAVIQLGVDYVNSPHIIARNPRVVAINSAVQVDLTGQICADSFGARIISGVGGQMDFMRGACLSEGGKPIIALTSRTSQGASRIVASLERSAGVVTTRAHARYVITENGVADLYGRTLAERARALMAIAHPDDRESLEREWHALHASRSLRK